MIAYIYDLFSSKHELKTQYPLVETVVCSSCAFFLLLSNKYFVLAFAANTPNAFAIP